MRPFALILFQLPAALVLAGCSEVQPSGNQTVPVPEQAEQDDLVECAPGGAASFTRSCSVEQVRDEDGLVLVLRAPDGGFRRLRITQDGRGVVAADGSEPAVVVPSGPDRIEVSVGRDRYRLAATVKGRAP